MQVLWLERAVADLDEIFAYLLERNPSAARRVYEAIREQVGRLSEHPASGRRGRVSGTRELVIARTPYVVA